MMHLPLLLLAVAQSAAPPSPNIIVTGHAWAPFISPMGQPFRARSPTDDTLADWFVAADTNRDGALTAAEMQADADRFFAKLDTDHDGEIEPDEIAQYEYDVAPEIQVMSKVRPVPGQAAPALAAKPDADEFADLGRKESRASRRARADQDFASLGFGGALQGAARYSLLNLPEPVAAADADFNGAVTLQEFRAAALERFALLDSARQGRLSVAQLEALPHAPKPDRTRSEREDRRTDTRVGTPVPKAPNVPSSFERQAGPAPSAPRFRP